jgi:bifunctional enzyme CysN/CysC
MIDFAPRRATNIHRHHPTVGKAERTQLMHHKPAVLWFTGLPGAGKSELALDGRARRDRSARRQGHR